MAKCDMTPFAVLNDSTSVNTMNRGQAIVA